MILHYYIHTKKENIATFRKKNSTERITAFRAYTSQNEDWIYSSTWNKGSSGITMIGF